MAIIRGIVHVLSWICYVLIGLYVAICAPMLFGCKPEVVLTGSMLPTYGPGTIIYYKKVPREEIQAGDVISFKGRESIVTHRVARIEGDEYVTKGDANESEDHDTVKYDDIQGKVGGWAIPMLGWGIMAVNSYKFIFLIVIAILMAEYFLGATKKHEK